MCGCGYGGGRCVCGCGYGGVRCVVEEGVCGCGYGGGRCLGVGIVEGGVCVAYFAH